MRDFHCLQDYHKLSSNVAVRASCSSDARNASASNHHAAALLLLAGLPHAVQQRCCAISADLHFL
jgi:hypothetical protein